MDVLRDGLELLARAYRQTPLELSRPSSGCTPFFLSLPPPHPYLLTFVVLTLVRRFAMPSGVGNALAAALQVPPSPCPASFRPSPRSRVLYFRVPAAIFEYALRGALPLPLLEALLFRRNLFRPAFRVFDFLRGFLCTRLWEFRCMFEAPIRYPLARPCSSLNSPFLCPLRPTRTQPAKQPGLGRGDADGPAGPGGEGLVCGHCERGGRPAGLLVDAGAREWDLKLSAEPRVSRWAV